MTLKAKWLIAFVVEHAFLLCAFGLAWSIDWRFGVALIVYDIHLGVEPVRSYFGKQIIALRKAKALKEKEKKDA